MTINAIPRALAAVAALLAAAAGQAALAPYSQNFEALGAANSAALSGAGFLVAGSVFDGNTGAAPPYGNFKFFYGNFVAPNGGGGFSAIASGEAGAAQGAQYLNAFSDYNCCTSPNQGHLDPTAPYDYVQSSVFQQQTIGAADIGATWTLSFDGKLPASNGCGTAAASTCIAFIRTQDPNNGYATTYRATFDAKTLATSAWSRHVLSITLGDPALSGQVLQFGFMSTSRQFGSSGVYYDNIYFAAATDTDGDGIPDAVDNCTLVANPDQRDTNGDGYGNLCDPDFNNDGIVNINDFNRLKARLGVTPVVDVDTDLDGNGAVNINDLNRLKSYLGKPPGPSGLAHTPRPLPGIYATGKAVAYSAYRAGGPGVGEVPSDANVLQDLQLLHDAGFNLVRLFGADSVSDKILRLAAASFPDMKFQLGIYLTGPAPSCVNSVNSAQIAKGTSLASQYPNVATVSVGNETSLVAGLDITCLAGYVQTVRSQVTQPVTVDDIYDFYKGSFSSYRPDTILTAIDFVSMHTYPFLNYAYWNWQQTGTPAGPARAAAMMNAALATAQANYTDVYNYLYRNAAGNTVSIGTSLPIVVGETGWKAVQTNGASTIETYAATEVNAKWYHDLLATWERSAGGPATIFKFEAFDEAWKGTDDGWGLWDRNRLARYALCGTPAGAPCNANLYQGAGYYPF